MTNAPGAHRQHVDRLISLETAQRLDFTAAEIAKVLAFRERGQRPCTYVLDVLDRQADVLDRRIAELVALRAEMVALKAQADRVPEQDACYCIIEHATAIWASPSGVRGRPWPIPTTRRCYLPAPTTLRSRSRPARRRRPPKQELGLFP